MKQASISITDHNKKKNAQILIEGELVVGSLHKVKEELTAAVSRYSTLTIVVKNVSAIDLTFLQLLFAVKKSLALVHKSFSFHVELPDEITTLLSRSGFADLSLMLQPIHSSPAKK
jgi:ABC-type transporter Mla MlaB component